VNIDAEVRCRRGPRSFRRGAAAGVLDTVVHDDMDPAAPIRALAKLDRCTRTACSNGTFSGADAH
jgi:hypothetical protein